MREACATFKAEIERRMIERNHFAHELHDTFLPTIRACELAIKYALDHSEDVALAGGECESSWILLTKTRLVAPAPISHRYRNA
jgi:hypothetical protein